MPAVTYAVAGAVRRACFGTLDGRVLTVNLALGSWECQWGGLTRCRCGSGGVRLAADPGGAAAAAPRRAGVRRASGRPGRRIRGPARAGVPGPGRGRADPGRTAPSRGDQVRRP